MSLIPVPFFNEELDVFWKNEIFDNMLPTPGFITDMVTSLRGVESPTKTAAWSAVFTLSSVMKRDSYLIQHPSRIFPNFFIIIVGPPRIVAKSTVVNYADEYLLMDFHDELPDEYLKKLKRLNILRSRATPEALSVVLAPEVEVMVVDRKMKNVDRGSQLVLILSELATFLGKQKYNTGLVTKLINLYDCRKFDDDHTIARGNLPMRDVYVTLFGATTRDGLESSVAGDAFGSGFMSRIVLVHTDRPTRVFPQPIPTKLKDGTSIDWPLELRKRLAWIAVNSMGEYILEEDAQEFYNSWYRTNHKALTRKAGDPETELRSRIDVHLMKLAMIFRAQRYEPGRLITLQDMTEAHRFLLSTYEDAFSVVEDAINPRDFNKWMNRIVTLLKRDKELSRTMVLRQLSPYGCKKDDVNLILRQLYEERRISIFTAEGDPKTYPSSDGKELYRWKKGLQT